MGAQRKRNANGVGSIYFHPPASVKFFPKGAGGKEEGEGGAGAGGKEEGDEKDEGEGDEKDEGEGDGGAGDSKKGKGDDKVLTLKQSEVDRIVSNARREEQKSALKKVEKALQEKDLTERERKRLETNKTELEAALMSEKQASEEKIKKLDREWKAKHDAESTEKTQWKDRFTKSVIRRAIVDAAKLANAHDESQILDMFENKVQLREIIGDDSKPTGEFEAVIELKEKQEDGKMKKRIIPIDQYIAEEHSVAEKSKNLYDSTRKGGSGFRPGSGSGGAGAKLSSRDRIARGLAEARG